MHQIEEYLEENCEGYHIREKEVTLLFSQIKMHLENEYRENILLHLQDTLNNMYKKEHKTLTTNTNAK